MGIGASGKQRTDALVEEAVKEALQEQREVQPHEVPFKIRGWRYVIAPLPPKKQAGSIILASETQKAEEVLTSVGRVLQVGFHAEKSKTPGGLDLSEEPVKPKVGDYVMYERYAAGDVHLADGRKLVIVSDTSVYAVVTDPDAIRRYV